MVDLGEAQTHVATPPSAATAQLGQPVQIDRNGVLILIRSTMLAVEHANRTGNYTVLRDLGAPGFQAANTAARLGEIFANLRGQNFDLSGVAVLEPQLTTLPTSERGGMMRIAGFFPSTPLQLNFDLLFEPVEGKWRLFGIALNLGQSGPVAPDHPGSTPSAEPNAETKSQTEKPKPPPRPSR